MSLCREPAGQLGNIHAEFSEVEPGEVRALGLYQVDSIWKIGSKEDNVCLDQVEELVEPGTTGVICSLKRCDPEHVVAREVELGALLAEYLNDLAIIRDDQ